MEKKPLSIIQLDNICLGDHAQVPYVVVPARTYFTNFIYIYIYI